MSYREDNKMFLDLLDAVREVLKDTNYKVYVSSLSEPESHYDEDNPSDDWKEFIALDKDPALHECECSFDGWGQKIAILDPTVQKPTYDNHYKYAQVVLTEDYEHFDRYFISRMASYRFDAICCDSETRPSFTEWFIKYEDTMEYVRNHLLSDLEYLSSMSKKLAELHKEASNLSALKCSKDDYYEN